MPTWAQWLGWAIGILGFGLFLWQWHLETVQSRLMDARERQLVGIKTALDQLLSYLNEGVERKTAISTPQMEEWVGSVGHQVNNLRTQVDIMLGSFPAVRREESPSFWIRVRKKLFPLSGR